MSLPIAVGDILLGKYRVERVLGQGGMGVVVAVRHIELGELFAMKFLLPAALAHPDAVERFLREARASARLKGEHVVRVQDVGRLPDGMPYMVMEHLSGCDLKDLLAQRGPLPVHEALSYVLQACEALAEAHAEGIVHRDLKPANMFLVARRAGSPCVKVLDFGISKQLEPETVEQQALTRTGMVLGSPLYMSPEQMMRTKEADPRGDIWSMGVVLYELLTGTVPFLSGVLTELVGKVLTEAPLPPSHHRPDLPPEVDALVMTCLEKRREQRFQSVDQLMEALRAALSRAAAAPQTSTPSGTLLLDRAAPGAVSGSGPRPLPVLPAAAAPPPPGATVAQTAQTWGTTAGPAHAARPPSRAGLFLVFGALGVIVLAGGVFGAWYLGKDSTGAAVTAPPYTDTPPTTGLTVAPASNAGAMAAPLAGSDATIDPASPGAPQPGGRPGSPSSSASASATPTVSATATATATATASTTPTATPTATATMAGMTCKTRFDCRAPLVCSGGLCLAPTCTGDASCGPGRYCSLEGRCEALSTPKPVPACKSHLDCTPPLVCPAGACVAPQCTSDAACGPGRFCSLEGQCKSSPGAPPR